MLTVPPIRSTEGARCDEALIKAGLAKSSPSFSAQISMVTAVNADVMVASGFDPSTLNWIAAVATAT